MLTRNHGASPGFEGCGKTTGFGGTNSVDLHELHWGETSQRVEAARPAKNTGGKGRNVFAGAPGAEQNGDQFDVREHRDTKASQPFARTLHHGRLCREYAEGQGSGVAGLAMACRRT